MIVLAIALILGGSALAFYLVPNHRKWAIKIGRGHQPKEYGGLSGSTWLKMAGAGIVTTVSLFAAWFAIGGGALLAFELTRWGGWGFLVVAAVFGFFIQMFSLWQITDRVYTDYRIRQ